MRKSMIGVAFLVWMLVGVSGAQANTIRVNTTVDSFDDPATCSLRSAVYSADHDVATGGCTIEAVGQGADFVIVPGGEYRLTLTGSGEDDGKTGDLDVHGGFLRLEPSGADQKVTIDGAASDRIFDVFNGDFRIKSMSLVNGSAPGTAPGDGGGAIRGTGGDVNIYNSLFFDNRAESDGGAFYFGGTHAYVMASTITSNQADGSGGGMFLDQFGPGAFRGDTVVFNTADADGDGNGDGGGVATGSSGANGFVGYLNNAILADNIDASPVPADRMPDCFLSPGGGFELNYTVSTQTIDDPGCLMPGKKFDHNNISPADPGLQPLNDNGGQTRTHAIGLLSPAAGTGFNVLQNPEDGLNLCTLVDQREVPRIFGKCDMGAYQINGGMPGVSMATRSTASLNQFGLGVVIRCPARFKPKCVSTVVLKPKVEKSWNMSTPLKVTVRSGRSKEIGIAVKPLFQQKVADMAADSGPKLIVKQVVKSKRVGKKKASKPTIIIRKVKVRNFVYPPW